MGMGMGLGAECSGGIRMRGVPIVVAGWTVESKRWGNAEEECESVWQALF